MAKANHVHKFKRHRYKSGNIVFFCATDDCSIKLAPALALGKQTICWRCGEPFELDEYSVRLVKPHCHSCHRTKGLKIEETNEAIEPILSLAERLSKTIQSGQQQANEEDI